MSLESVQPTKWPMILGSTRPKFAKSPYLIFLGLSRLNLSIGENKGPILPEVEIGTEEGKRRNTNLGFGHWTVMAILVNISVDVACTSLKLVDLVGWFREKHVFNTLKFSNQRQFQTAGFANQVYLSILQGSSCLSARGPFNTRTMVMVWCGVTPNALVMSCLINWCPPKIDLGEILWPYIVYFNFDWCWLLQIKFWKLFVCKKRPRFEKTPFTTIPNSALVVDKVWKNATIHYH